MSHELINQNSADVEYYTDPLIIEAARDALGGIDLDPASCARANKLVRAERFFGIEDNGLMRFWDGRVWMNHPFGREEAACNPCGANCPRFQKNPKHVCHAYDLFGNKRWILSLVNAYQNGFIEAACNITFAATSEAWFQPLARRPQCFLTPRTNYYIDGPDGTLIKKPGVTKGSVVTYFGKNLERFAEAFKSFGEVKVPYRYSTL